MGKKHKPFTGEIEHHKAVGKGPHVDLPPERLPEVAFIGRSNVGKSSLINALLGRKNIAKTSSKPGATRALHFFSVNEEFTLVDLPGYGYAALGRETAENLSKRVQQYFRERCTLKCVYVLVDTRRGLKEVDEDMLQTLSEMGVPSRIVLTKGDKAKHEERDKVIKSLADRGGAMATAMMTGFGIDEVRSHMREVCGL